MWKLTLHQKKWIGTYESEHTVEYLGTVTELLFLLTRLTELKTDENTWYELAEVKEDVA